MTKVSIIVLAITLVIGLVAVTLAVIGVATKPWVDVSGNTHELKEKFTQLTNATGPFIPIVVNFLGPLVPSVSIPILTAVVVGVVNQTLIQVERQIGANLQPTTYSLFDKTIGNTTKTVEEFRLPQGLIIVGLVWLFIGGVLAVLTTATSLNKSRFLRLTPLFFFLVGSILILLGYLLFTKIIVEDFGHELGIKSHLGFSLILVVLSSIVGFITATIYGATKLFQRYRSDILVRQQPSTINGQVPLVDRPPTRQQRIKIEETNVSF